MTPGKNENTRLVYSTDQGRVREQAETAPVREPGDGVVRVSRSKAGRNGKTVTLLTGVPAADLPALAKELKRTCGSGGAVKDGVLELQGDHRAAVLARLAGRYRVKSAGG